MAFQYAIFCVSFVSIGFGFRSEVAVGSSGQAALVGSSEFEDVIDDNMKRFGNGDGAAVVAADAAIADLPGDRLSDAFPAKDLLDVDALSDRLTRQTASKVLSLTSATVSLSGGRHTARYMSIVARSESSDNVSAGLSAEVAERTVPEIGTPSVETAEARPSMSAASSPNMLSVASPDATLGPLVSLAFEGTSSLEGNAPSKQAVRAAASKAMASSAPAAEPSAAYSQNHLTASLLEGRVAVWASRTVAQVAARSRSVPGDWGKAVIVACLVFLMILCASPCAAALCPVRSPPKSERPRRRPLPKSVVVGKRGLTRQEKLGDILADVASSGSEADTEKLSSSIPKDLSELVASISVGRCGEEIPTDAAKKSPGEDPERSRRREAKQVVTEVAQIAKHLQTSAFKYPKSGRSGFFFSNSAQKRFLLVLPQPDPEPPKKRSDGVSEPTHELLLWRAGRLAWWETEASYQQKEKPKGSIPLARIHDVQEGDEPMSVVIEHQDRESRHTLELTFSSGETSKAWSARFRELLVKLNTDIR